MNKNNRNSNIELLRMLSMVSIVVLHYFNFGGALESTKNITNLILMKFFESISIIGVNIFVLITGYYMINKKKANINKVVNIILKIVIIGIVMYTVSLIFKINTFSIKDAVINIVPFFVGLKWFITSYTILFVLSPYINKLLNVLEKKYYIKLLIIMFICFNVTATFFIVPPIKDNGYGIVNFIVLYAIGGYLNKFKPSIENKKLIVALVGNIFIIFIMSLVTVRAWNYNSVFVMFASISLFYLMVKIKPKESKIINSIAKNTLGVYILHTNEAFRKFIYMDIMKCDKFYESQFFILHMFGCVIISYVIFTIVDKCIEFILEKTIYKLSKKIKFLNYIVEVK